VTSTAAISAEHHQILDAFRSTNVLMVVANPSVNPKLGWPLGFWAAELMHPYFEFTEAGFLRRARCLWWAVADVHVPGQRGSQARNPHVL